MRGSHGVRRSQDLDAEPDVYLVRASFERRTSRYSPDMSEKTPDMSEKTVADGSNYRDDSKRVADEADGSNYREAEAEGSEPADGSSLRDDTQGIAESADGSNYHNSTTERHQPVGRAAL